MIVENFPENITCRGAVVFEKWVKQCHGNSFCLSDDETKIVLACKNVFSLYCFTHFITAPPQLIFLGALSTIIIFKLCRFNVNLWTLCFVLQNEPKSFKGYYGIGTFCMTQHSIHNVHRFTPNSQSWQFENKAGRKLPLKLLLLKCCSFWEMSKTSNKNNVCL